MSAATFGTVDWDGVELLPKESCSVCGVHAVPWGRALDDAFFCSRRCCDARAMRANLREPAFQAFLRDAGFAAARNPSVTPAPGSPAELAAVGG